MLSILRAQVLGAALVFACSAAALEPGKAAPAWSLQSHEGTEIEYPRIAEGKPSVLLFLADPCVDCAGLLQAMQGLREDYAARMLEIYAIAPGDARQLLGDAIDGLDFVLLSDGAQLATEYTLGQTPALLLVDPQGIVRWIGSPEERAGAFREALELIAPASH